MSFEPYNSPSYPSTPVAPVAPAPPAPPVPDTQVVYAPRPSSNWLMVVLVCAVIFLGILQIGSCTGPFVPDDRRSDIKADGIVVLVVEEEARQPRHEWEPGQLASLVEIRRWAVENATEIGGDTAYAALDKDQDLSKGDPIWKALMGKSTLPAPSVLVLNKDRLFEFELYEDEGDMIKALDRTK